jgi:hypothetical protein
MDCGFHRINPAPPVSGLIWPLNETGWKRVVEHPNSLERFQR